ncbi:MAG: FKBP-type peptidyl-prolyl cis-trans isomerase [bacterium]
MKIENGKLVKVEYSISVAGVGVIESSESRGPLEFVQGENALPMGLETQLEGLGVGDEKNGEFEVEIPTMDMARKEFPQDFDLKVGARFTGKNQDQEVEFSIEKVEDKKVVVRPVHPLAGKKLSYKVKVLAVNDKA